MTDTLLSPVPPMPRTLRIEGVDHAVLDRPVPPQWAVLAAAKGFDIAARVKDKNHLALACRACGALNLVKAFTLRTARPLCKACLAADWAATAEAAGAKLLRRCRQERGYVWLALPCGHELRRQMEFVRRVARGDEAFRCETCHAARERREAEARGWRLLGPDPKGEPGYRLYAHAACGHVQRVARANMRSGRFNCAGCGTCWSAAPSAIYLLRIALPGAGEVLKLGMSRDPLSRMRHQLPRHADVGIEIVDSVALPRGQTALRVEKGIHAILRRRFPEHVVPPDLYAPHLKVGSEIYAPRLEPWLRRAMDRVRARFPPPAPV